MICRASGNGLDYLGCPPAPPPSPLVPLIPLVSLWVDSAALLLTLAHHCAHAQLRSWWAQPGHQLTVTPEWLNRGLRNKTKAKERKNDIDGATSSNGFLNQGHLTGFSKTLQENTSWVKSRSKPARCSRPAEGRARWGATISRGKTPQDPKIEVMGYLTR